MTESDTETQTPTAAAATAPTGAKTGAKTSDAARSDPKTQELKTQEPKAQELKAQELKGQELKGQEPPPRPAEKPAAQEIEIKFATDADGFAAALAAPELKAEGAASPAKKLVSVYFDTPNWDLKQRKIALRIRKSGRSAPIMTLKYPLQAVGGSFARGEIEVRSARLEPDLALFDAEIAEGLRAIIGDAPLQAKYETRVNRVTRLMTRGSAQIELAFDEGAIRAGERECPLREVEFELKSGLPQDFYDFAAQVAQNLPLRLDMISKAERAGYFCLGGAPKPVKAKAADIPAEVNLDEAIARVILGAIDHYLGNWASLRQSDAPESIHQMRVALRRLRAALGMLKRAIPCPEFDLFREEAKHLASALGAARDSDALRELIEDGPMAHFADKKDFAPLLAALEARRAAAYVEARALTDSARPTVFALRLSAFVARRGWRNAVTGLDLATLTAPAPIFAGQALERLYRRVIKRGKRLVELPDEERHEVRIALKNLRYAGEFFAGCFGDCPDAAPFLRAAGSLQGLLGAHNDAASADAFLSEQTDPAAAHGAGVVSGWYARNALIADAGLAREWKKFKHLKPFWR